MIFLLIVFVLLTNTGMGINDIARVGKLRLNRVALKGIVSRSLFVGEWPSKVV